MGTNFPTGIDNIVRPDPGDPLSNANGRSQSQLFDDMADAIEAVEAKVGTNGSGDTNSIDYKTNGVKVSALAALTAVDPGDEIIVLDKSDTSMGAGGTDKRSTVAAVASNGTGVINVKTYLATGNGTTDDTTAIQAAINAVPATGGTVFIPSGTYKLTATLTIPDVRGLRIVGASWNNCELRMFTNNVPIIKTTGTFQRGLEFSELRLSYTNQQNFASHPLSAAIHLDSSVPASACYYSKFSRLYLEKATWGVLANNALSVWNCTFEDFQCAAIEHSIMTLSPSPATGQPVNYFKRITSLGEGGPATTGVALQLANEARLSAIDIEDWTGPILNLDSGTFTIDGMHIERHHGSNFISCFWFSNCTARFDGLNFDGGITTAISPYFFAITNARVEIGPAQINLQNTGGGNWTYLLASDTTSSIDVAYPMMNPATAAPLDYFMFPGNANTLAVTRTRPGPGGVQTKASTATVTLPEYGSLFTISGTTTITSITASHAERRVTLIFSGALTFTDGSNLKLAGNLVTTADDTITLVCDGTNWYETSRSVN